ncbi:hypothetical protein [Streptomyces boncukensis]|uniref:hypothetical protein n=1 Tax=Streptomyces boncukensis TaxID=2711219 RepID=UPI001F499F43|nr:hypothetical protein [Streptomyces boncukensis]
MRDGAPEGADFVAEWRLANRVVRTLTIRMLLLPEEHEVLAIEEQHEVSAYRQQWGRGPARTVRKEWTLERGADGRRHFRESFSFDSADMTQCVLDTVLQAGWTWRSLLSKDF